MNQQHDCIGCPYATRASQTRHYRLGNLHLDIATRTLSTDVGEVERLSPQMTKVLAALIKAESAPVHADQLLLAMYGGDEQSENANRVLTVVLSKLRRVLDAHAPDLRLINIFGTGYRLVRFIPGSIG